MLYPSKKQGQSSTTTLSLSLSRRYIQQQRRQRYIHHFRKYPVLDLEIAEEVVHSIGISISNTFLIHNTTTAKGKNIVIYNKNLFTMPLTKVAIPSSASRCCRLAQQFSSALSLSSPSSSLATRSGQSRAGKAATNHFSTVAHQRPLSWTNNNMTTKLQSAATISGNAQDSNSSFQFRSMGTSNRKVIDAKNAKRLRIQQKKKKNANAPKKVSLVNA